MAAGSNLCSTGYLQSSKRARRLSLPQGHRYCVFPAIPLGVFFCLQIHRRMKTPPVRQCCFISFSEMTSPGNCLLPSWTLTGRRAESPFH
jgi:hypothetical protein